MNIQQLIYSMLIENTGTHFLDSGGDNNRHWQHNQEKTFEDFKNEPEVKVYSLYANDKIKKLSDVDYTISTFHYLNSDFLELDEVCNEFNTKFNKMNNWNSDIYGVSDTAYNWLNQRGLEVKYSENTYNYDSHLDQTLQYTSIKLNGDDDYLLLQIHGGTDVRGGYTDAKLFKFNDWNGFGVDHAILYPEEVGSLIIRKDKRLKEGEKTIYIGNSYGGYSITTEDGNDLILKKNEEVSLGLSLIN